MIHERGVGAERPGPFSLLEPLGLLWGRDAHAALRLEAGLPLAGGPGVFTMVRFGEQVLSAADAALAWGDQVGRLVDPVPEWAGLGAGLSVMGILNVTPDSFSDGGERMDAGAAIAVGLRMMADGADVLDIGGESTRPGAAVVPEAEEQRRVLPVIGALARAGAVISVDTRNASTMVRALETGARIVNDVSALVFDPTAAGVVARMGCPVVLMHMRGTPATMSGQASYRDVTAEVVAELAARVAAAEAAGIRREQIAIDPGFGFAKTAAQNLVLLERLAALLSLGLPIMAGISRKATIGMLTGVEIAAERDAGSLAAHLACLSRGARVVRTHNVALTVQAVAVWRALTR